MTDLLKITQGSVLRKLCVELRLFLFVFSLQVQPEVAGIYAAATAA